ncbi:UNVERIFIED_ORG: 23S rRNA-/tRNA-specific pseudouridylate synthase [Heyndrickxia coagulans]
MDKNKIEVDLKDFLTNLGLAERIRFCQQALSRNQICSLIKEEKILLNKNVIKNNTVVKEKDTIEIFI